MDTSNLRSYEVQYNITSNIGQAAAAFESIATSAQNAEVPLKTMQTYLTTTIREIQGLMDQLKTGFTSNFKIDTAKAQASFKELEEMAKLSAQRINSYMAQAMSGKGIGRSVQDIEKDLNKARQELAKYATTDKQGKVTGYTDAGKAINKRIKSLEKEKAKAQAIANGVASANKNLAGVKNLPVEDFDKASTALERYNTAVSGFNGKKKIAPAISGKNFNLTKENIEGLKTISEAITKLAWIPQGGIPPINLNVNTAGVTEALTKLQIELKEKGKVPSINIKLDTAAALEKFTKFETDIKTKLSELPTSIKVSLETKGAKGKWTKFINDLKAKQAEVPNVKLVLNTAEAKAAFETLVGELKGATVPVSVKLTPSTSGKKGVKGGKEDDLTTVKGANKVVGKLGTAINNFNNRKTISPKVNVDSEAVDNLGKLAENITALNKAVAKGQNNIPKITVHLDTTKAIAQLEELVAKINSTVATVKTGLAAGSGTTGTNTSNNKVASSSSTTLIGSSSSSGSTQNAKNPPSGGTLQTKNGSMITPANTKKWQEWRSKIEKDAMNKRLGLAKQDKLVRERRHAATQKMYEGLFKNLTPYEEQIQQQEQARQQAQERSAQFQQQRQQARELAQRRMIASSNQPLVMPSAVSGQATRSESTGGRGRSTYTRRVVRDPRDTGSSRGRGVIATSPLNRPDLYTRSRKFWYPFSGNTSFGARTPMAVDMAKGMGAMFAIGGAMSAVGDSFGQAVNYQNTMKTVQAILKEGGSEYSDSSFKNMENTVRDVGKKTKFTAPQVADAARFLAMAGYDIKGINAAIRPVADIAVIGDNDLGEVADKLTNVMTTFGIAPENMRSIADIMTTTFTRSNTDMMMLAESAKYAGAIAHMYGKDHANTFADTMAMFGVLGNAGIQSSMAGTTVRMMYQNMMQPNKNQKATLKKYGIYTRDNQGQPLEMVDILAQISKKVPKKQLADAVGNMFRITAQPGAAALSSHMPELVKLMQANREAAGSGVAERISLEKQGTIQGLWYQVTSAFTEAVVQAFEQREGGWAGMLANLRDYLAKPETIKILANIVDLVETLGKVMAKFADIWAKAYSLAPGLFKTWMYAQLVFTQIGYLVTPFIQLLSVVTSLKNAIISTNIASAAAGLGRGGSGIVGAATTLTGGVSNASARATALNNIRSTYAQNMTSMAPAMASNAPLVGGQMAFAAANAGAFAGMDYKRMTYERKLFRMKNTVPYYNPTLDKVGRVAVSPLWHLPMSALATSPKNQVEFDRLMRSGEVGLVRNNKNFNPNNWDKKINYAQNLVRRSKLQRYSANQALRLPKQLANQALLTRYLQIFTASTKGTKWEGKLSQNALMAKNALSQIEAKQNYLTQLREQRHAYQVNNSALMQRYNAMYGAQVMANGADNAALIAQWQQNKANRRTAAITTMRNARVGDHGMAVYQRAASMGKLSGAGWKSGAKMAFKAGTSVSIFTDSMSTIRSTMFNLMTGLAKAVGLLLNPVTLVIGGITALGAGLYFLNKHLKDRQKTNIDNAMKTQKNAEAQRQNNNKIINNAWKEAVGGHSILSSNTVNLPGNIVKRRAASAKSAFSDAFSKSIDKNTSEKIASMWQRQVLSDSNMSLAIGQNGLNTLSGLTGTAKSHTPKAMGFYASQQNAIDNYSSPAQQAKLMAIQGVIAAGGGQTAVQNAQLKIRDLREKLIAKKIKQADYDKQTKAIIDSVANVNAPGLLDASIYTPDQIQTMDWTMFKQYQQGALNVLEAERNALAGSLSGYIQGTNTLKNGVVLYSQDWITAINQVIAGYRYPLEVAGQTVNVALRLMPNGQIDTSYIINQVKSIADNLQLNITEFANMSNSVMEIMLNASGGKGNYYSTWIKTFEQLRGDNTTISKSEAEWYWNNQIASKGLKKWGNLDKQGYIKMLTSTDNNDRNNAERSLVGSVITRRQAVKAKNDYDKKQKDAAAAAQKAKEEADKINNGSKNGTVAGGTNGKDTKSKDYKNKYDRSSARPTQVIINIDKLCNFDRTAIASNADEQAIMKAVENNVVQAISMLTSTALTEAGSLISQGV